MWYFLGCPADESVIFHTSMIMQEELLWNFFVLQTAHLANFVLSFGWG
jgi:hypothetical protein